jgi:hypothetical protein
MRPKASDKNKAIALAFAQCVTAPSTERDFVARHGRLSLFSAFEQAFPDLARDAHDPQPLNRGGVAESELNKLLEKLDGNIFQRRRNRSFTIRRGQASSRTPLSSLAGSGSWMFFRLRWRDPDCPEDLADLRAKLASLDDADAIDADKVIDVVRRIRHEWLQLIKPGYVPTTKALALPEDPATPTAAASEGPERPAKRQKSLPALAIAGSTTVAESSLAAEQLGLLHSFAAKASQAEQLAPCLSIAESAYRLACHQQPNHHHHHHHQAVQAPNQVPSAAHALASAATATAATMSNSASSMQLFGAGALLAYPPASWAASATTSTQAWPQQPSGPSTEAYRRLGLAQNPGPLLMLAQQPSPAVAAAAAACYRSQLLHAYLQSCQGPHAQLLSSR